MSDSGPTGPAAESPEPDPGTGGAAGAPPPPYTYSAPYAPPGSPPPPPPGAAPSGTSFNLNVKLPPIDAEALSKTPWVVGAVAILVGLVLYWFGSVISAFEHFEGGFGFRDRLLRILGPGDAAWAVAVLIAVALLVLGSTSDDKRSAVVGFVYQLLLLAAALIAVAGAVNAIIELTTFGNSFDLALSGFLQYLAAVPIAGAAGLWAWRAHPTGLPGQKQKTS